MGVYKFNSRIIAPNQYPFWYADAIKTWTPSEITTDLWLDASDTDFFTLDDSNNVEQWDDRSGNNRHAIQTSSALRPTLVTGGLNSQDTLSFNGSSQYMTHAVITSNPTDLHIFAVSKYTGSNSGVLWGHRSDTTRLIQLTWQSNTELNLQLRSSVSSLVTVSKTVSSGQWINASAKFSASTSEHNVWDHGIAATQNTTDFAGQNFSSSTESIGVTFSPSLAAYFEGQIAELIVINGLVSTTDRQNIEGYLAHKWGLTEKLPSNHPYKMVQP